MLKTIGGRSVRVEARIKHLRREFDGRTQAVRGSLMAELEELQKWAAERAKAVRDERLKQKWAHIAAYIAQTITYIAREYDASKIDQRLDELERLFSEFKAKKSGVPDQGN